MPTEILIEICAGSVESAIAAEKGGAHRIELCSALALGGLTPSRGMIEYATTHLKIRTFVLIRPREGDFHYSRAEVEVMKADIGMARASGAHGIVTGMLNTDSTVDSCRMKELVETAYPLPVTFHRAFDMARNPFEALEEIVALGCERILTSGMAKTAPEGAGMLSELVKEAGNRIVIMPGSGVNASNLVELHATTGAREFHSSAGTLAQSRMAYRKKGIPMGRGADEAYGFQQTDRNLVSELCRIAAQLTG